LSIILPHRHLAYQRILSTTEQAYAGYVHIKKGFQLCDEQDMYCFVTASSVANQWSFQASVIGWKK